MGSTGAIVSLAAFLILGLSIWGLFTNARSILFIGAGITTMIGASIGAMHAWGESQSIAWTIAYLVAALVGLACVVRNAKSKRMESRSAPAGPGSGAGPLRRHSRPVPEAARPPAPRSLPSSDP